MRPAGFPTRGALGRPRLLWGGGPATAAAGSTFKVPGIVRREESRVLGGRTHCELIHVCLAEHYHACRVQALHHRGVERRLEVLKHVGAAGGGNVLRANYVLNRQGNTRQW